jgi:6-methylsalicylate decarboxylase
LGNPRASRIFNTCLCCNTKPPVAAGINRRTLLSGLIAGVSAGVITRGTSALAQPAVAPRPALIDVHHHVVPPFYLADNREHLAGPTGQINPAWTNWEPTKALDAMDAQGCDCRSVAVDAGRLVW